ncbi:hypothetical protein DFQ27_004461 [Actinomortierella ambigua]|uniref:SAP domain-containing protein n=1 Tax=Actinomortierella ambigua TaxID=1343610 RepID=A0A9P6QK63_9FUNG|nr:hypothetical protein DFQ27_004461 [Actinomortierella ambigua]
MDLNSLKVTELRSELSARGLSTKGVKKDLVARLEEALANEASSGSGTTPTNNDDSNEDNKDNATPMDQDSLASTTTTTDNKLTTESNELAKIAPPTTASNDDAAQVASAPVPIPASAPGTTLSSLEPVVGTPSLVQEGLVDTTSTAASVPTEKASASAPVESVEMKTAGAGQKRSKADQEKDDGEEVDKEGTKEDDKDQEGRSAKKARHGSATTSTSAATLSATAAEVDRRSDAPSPSPLQSAVATLSPVQSNNSSISSSGGVGREEISPEADRKGGERRIDARSLMERQVHQAVKDRVSDHDKGSSTDAQDTTAGSGPAQAEKAKGKEDQPVGQDRALTIINFVRPLTLPQVKRMLSEFGEVEHFWMDSIKTHCYVTYQTVEMAQKAYKGVEGVVFPKETGKALEAHFISAEDALWSSEEGEKAQNNRQRPTVFLGGPSASEKRKAEEARHKMSRTKEEAMSAAEASRPSTSVIGKGDSDEKTMATSTASARQVPPRQVVQPNELFQRTTTLPVLYFKALVDPPAKPTPTING